MEVVVTTGAINSAKLHSNRHHQQTVAQPTVSKLHSCISREKNRSFTLLKPVEGLFHCSLETSFVPRGHTWGCQLYV